MTLFDPDAWDGTLESLPENMRAKLAGTTPTPPTADAIAAKDAEMDERVSRLLNKRTIDQHLSAIAARAPAETFVEKSAKFRQAVSAGGLTVDQATELYFPKGDVAADTLTPPPRDPAATGGGLAPPPITDGGAWTPERVAEQRKALRQMPMSKALAWRRDEANAAFLKAEMTSYAAGSSL